MSGCGDPGSTNGSRREHTAASAGAGENPQPRTRVLLINGGGSPERNYQSHLLHVRELVDLLVARGVDRADMTVFTSDGVDPTPDLAIVDRREDGDFWLIEGLPVGEALRPEIRLADSRVEGVRVESATRAAIAEWLAKDGATMRAGDTLFVYVTDHGWKNPSDLDDNGIVLWGENLRVSELRSLLGALPSGVRVVTVMSQCFSGSFANLIYGGASVDGRICGYFSATRDRYAYGCYAENRGRDNVGHSFRFIEGLRSSRRFVDAHDTVLLDDATPDVPHRTSDFYLDRVLRSEAQRRGISFDVLVDELLEQAWADELHYVSEFGRIDAVGTAYGAFAPRSLRELDERAANLPALGEDLRAYAQQWRTALQELKRRSFAEFVAARPHWREYAAPEFVRSLDMEEGARVRDWLLEDFGEYLDEVAVRRRMELLHTMATEAAAAAYRMAVREGAALRMRMLLVRIAGRVFLDRFGEDEQRAALERLEACEDFDLGGRVRPLGRERLESQPYPPLAEEMERLAAVLPGWLGIEYGPVDPATRRSDALPGGAMQVSRVYPHSPAARAGLLVGDIILGPPDAHFSTPEQLREWVLTSLVDQVRILDVLRAGVVRVFELRVGAPPA